jgi:splicing factor 3B subunit 3
LPIVIPCQTGANRDYIVIGSDSGKIAIVEFSAETNSFRTVHCETFGKTGCRRIVPGQYLACDPRGRAIMIGESQLLFAFVCGCEGPR